MKLTKLFRRMPKVRSGYRAVFVGRKYRKLREENKNVPKSVYIDSHDNNEVLYMFGVYLNDPGVRLYEVFHDGTQRRIKVCWTPFRYKE